MKIKASDETVTRMCALAVNASSPMGMGWLHATPKVFQASEFTDDAKGPWCLLDYVEGRMVKLRMCKTGPDTWEVPDQAPAPDYQSWCLTYPSYADLAKAAGASVA